MEIGVFVGVGVVVKVGVGVGIWTPNSTLEIWQATIVTDQIVGVVLVPPNGTLVSLTQ